MRRIGICQFAVLQLVKESAVDKFLSSPKDMLGNLSTLLCKIQSSLSKISNDDPFRRVKHALKVERNDMHPNSSKLQLRSCGPGLHFTPQWPQCLYRQKPRRIHDTRILP
jgi:hypothetical protein